MFSSADFTSTQKKELRRQLDQGHLIQVSRGFYENAQLWSGLYHYDKHRLRAIAVGSRLRGGALTGVSGAAVMGLPIRIPRNSPVCVVGNSRAKTGEVEVRRSRWVAGENQLSHLVEIGGFHVPVTGINDCLFHIARNESVEEAVVGMDYCLKNLLTSTSALELRCREYKGRVGIKKIQLALQLAEPLTESPMETRLRLAMLRAGLGGFLIQPDIFLFNSVRTIRPDFLFPSHMLAVEYDGEEKYGLTDAAVRNDMDRMHAASNSGITFLRVNKQSFADGSWLRDLQQWLRRPLVGAHRDVEIRGGRLCVNRWV